MHYQIEGFLKHSEKDNWNNGCTGEYQSFYIDYKLTAFSLTELIDKCRSFTNGELCDDLIEPNRLDFQCYENEDGEIPSKSEMDQFERGEIDLYLCDYSCIVQKVETADLTLEFEQFKSTCN